MRSIYHNEDIYFNGRVIDPQRHFNSWYLNRDPLFLWKTGSRVYMVVQQFFIPETEAFCFVFDRCPTDNTKLSLKQPGINISSHLAFSLLVIQLISVLACPAKS